MFCDIFEQDVSVFYVSTGTAANALALSHYAKPGGQIFCHTHAHIRMDECGAPEFMTNGNRLAGICGAGGKFTAGDLTAALANVPEGAVMSGQAAAVSISQGTESGTIYTVEEISALGAVAKSRGIPLHMDGARFANALVSLDVSPAEMTWKAGVDVLSFGGTKNGCWSAEAVVFFDKAQAEGFAYLQKRAGQVFSKARFVSAQFAGYLGEGHWLANARHANAMARKLSDGIVAAGGQILWPTEINEVFPVLKQAQVERLRSNGAKFYDWDALPEEGPYSELPDGEMALRLVTSFATLEEDVDRFLSIL